MPNITPLNCPAAHRMGHAGQHQNRQWLNSTAQCCHQRSRGDCQAAAERGELLHQCTRSVWSHGTVWCCQRWQSDGCQVSPHCGLHAILSAAACYYSSLSQLQCALSILLMLRSPGSRHDACGSCRGWPQTPAALACALTPDFCHPSLALESITCILAWAHAALSHLQRCA